MTEPPPVISTKRLSHRYGDHLAVRDLDLAVHRGEVYALLGTNGAGKTTTLEMLEGHRRPSSGTVSVLGGDPSDRRSVRPRMGVMLQESGFAADATVAESIGLSGAISGRVDEVARLLDVVDLGHRAGTRVGQLSGGEKRRLDFACAVWGTPELLFLDEPTTGLDPSARGRLWEEVARLKGEGVTVVLTTHYLEEAERHADRIGIMQHGRIAREGTLAELVAASSSTIAFVAPAGAMPPLPIARLEGAAAVVETDHPQRDLLALLEWADREGVMLDRLRVSSASLDDLFDDLGRESAAPTTEGTR